MRYLIGLLGVPFGILIIVYREKIKQVTGDFGFAESWFGSGGTYSFIAILGFAVSFFAIAYMFGGPQALFTSFLSPLFSSGQ